MSQFSVYMRFLHQPGAGEHLCRAVERALPQGGKVNIFHPPTNRYERAITYHGRSKQPAQKHRINSTSSSKWRGFLVF